MFLSCLPPGASASMNSSTETTEEILGAVSNGRLRAQTSKEFEQRTSEGAEEWNRRKTHDKERAEILSN